MGFLFRDGCWFWRFHLESELEDMHVRQIDPDPACPGVCGPFSGPARPRPRPSPPLQSGPLPEGPGCQDPAGRSGAGDLWTPVWGLIPHWAREKGGYATINARIETVLTRPAFRDSLNKRRALIPADGYYEWQATPRGKIPFYFRQKSGDPLALAGLWDSWRDPATGDLLETFTILVWSARPLWPCVRSMTACRSSPSRRSRRRGLIPQFVRALPGLSIWPVRSLRPHLAPGEPGRQLT